MQNPARVQLPSDSGLPGLNPSIPSIRKSVVHQPESGRASTPVTASRGGSIERPQITQIGADFRIDFSVTAANAMEGKSGGLRKAELKPASKSAKISVICG